LETFLAVIAFCIKGECAFFTSSVLFDSQQKCERELRAMQVELLVEHGKEVATLPTCLPISLKLA
jgi:hypothetical protein